MNYEIADSMVLDSSGRRYHQIISTDFIKTKHWIGYDIKPNTLGGWVEDGEKMLFGNSWICDNTFVSRNSSIQDSVIMNSHIESSATISSYLKNAKILNSTIEDSKICSNDSAIISSSKVTKTICHESNNVKNIYLFNSKVLNVNIKHSLTMRDIEASDKTIYQLTFDGFGKTIKKFLTFYYDYKRDATYVKVLSYDKEELIFHGRVGEFLEFAQKSWDEKYHILYKLYFLMLEHENSKTILRFN